MKQVLVFNILLILITACAPLSKTQPVSYIEPVTGMEFVAVPAGTFLMGDGNAKDPRALPVHKVSLDAFQIGLYEVTFDQYDLFCEVTGREKPDDNKWGRGTRPVINVSWYDATEFTNWLSSKTQLKFSLPTEAQWEYAARAGTTSTFWTGNQWKKGYGVCRSCGTPYDNLEPAPVGSFPPNRWGIYDMLGNVAEWVLDDYQIGYTMASPSGRALVNFNQNRKVQRGGAWNYPLVDLRSAARDERAADSRTQDNGFRLVINSRPTK